MLDQNTADRLWAERVEPTLRKVSYQYRYLEPDNSAEDLFQDLAVEVWLKTVEKFDMSKVKYTSDLDRAVYSLFQTNLNHILRNLQIRYNTEHATTTRGLGRLNRSVDFDEGVTLLDVLPSEQDLVNDTQERLAFEAMVNSLDPALEDILRFVITWDEPGPGSRSNLWGEVKNRWGLDSDEVFEQLVDEPEFMEYMQQAMGHEVTV